MKRSELKRKTPMKRGTSQLKRAPLKKMSKARAKLNRERSLVVAKIATVRPMCAWPRCHRIGMHPHEIWTRARATDIRHALLCEENIIMLCPEHHDFAHLHEEVARELGVIRRSHEGCPCGHGARGTS